MQEGTFLQKSFLLHLLQKTLICVVIRMVSISGQVTFFGVSVSAELEH